MIHQRGIFGLNQKYLPGKCDFFNESVPNKIEFTKSPEWSIVQECSKLKEGIIHKITFLESV